MCIVISLSDAKRLLFFTAIQSDVARERNLSSKNLIDGGRLLERALLDDSLSFLLHEEHERIERLLDVLPASFRRLETTHRVKVMTGRPHRRRR